MKLSSTQKYLRFFGSTVWVHCLFLCSGMLGYGEEVTVTFALSRRLRCTTGQKRCPRGTKVSRPDLVCSLIHLLQTRKKEQLKYKWIFFYHWRIDWKCNFHVAPPLQNCVHYMDHISAYMWTEISENGKLERYSFDPQFSLSPSVWPEITASEMFISCSAADIFIHFHLFSSKFIHIHPFSALITIKWVWMLKPVDGLGWDRMDGWKSLNASLLKENHSLVLVSLLL